MFLVTLVGVAKWREREGAGKGEGKRKKGTGSGKEERLAYHLKLA